MWFVCVWFEVCGLWLGVWVGGGGVGGWCVGGCVWCVGGGGVLANSKLCLWLIVLCGKHSQVESAAPAAPQKFFFGPKGEKLA